MREIEYRGLSKEYGWVYGYYVYDKIHNEHKIISYIDKDINDKTLDCIKQSYGCQKSHMYKQCTYIVDPESVGQYTGLKDKNDIKIYEGNTIRLIDPYTNTLSSGQAEIVFSYSYVGGWVARSGKEFCSIGVRTKNIMVFGNIYKKRR